MEEIEVKKIVSTEIGNEENHFAVAEKSSVTHTAGTLTIAECGALFRMEKDGEHNISILTDGEWCSECVSALADRFEEL